MSKILTDAEWAQEQNLCTMEHFGITADEFRELVWMNDPEIVGSDKFQRVVILFPELD